MFHRINKAGLKASDKQPGQNIDKQNENRID